MLLHTDRLENIHTYRIYPDIPKKLDFDEINDAILVQTNNKVTNNNNNNNNNNVIIIIFLDIFFTT